MLDTNQGESLQKKSKKLNPEIREKAEELFSLLEDEINKTHEDELAEEMAEELGDFLKLSKGFDQIIYAHNLAKTRSEIAVYGMEESILHMNDEAFSTLTELSENVLRIAEIWKTPDEDREEDFARFFNLYVEDAAREAKKIESYSSLWRYRAKSYRDEIEELKNRLEDK